MHVQGRLLRQSIRSACRCLNRAYVCTYPVPRRSPRGEVKGTSDSRPIQPRPVLAPPALPPPHPWSEEERLSAWQEVRASGAAGGSSCGGMEEEVLSPWSTSVSMHLALQCPPRGQDSAGGGARSASQKGPMRGEGAQGELQVSQTHVYEHLPLEGMQGVSPQSLLAVGGDPPRPLEAQLPMQGTPWQGQAEQQGPML
jgi:hypothetical protein